MADETPDRQNPQANDNSIQVGDINTSGSNDGNVIVGNNNTVV